MFKGRRRSRGRRRIPTQWVAGAGFGATNNLAASTPLRMDLLSMTATVGASLPIEDFTILRIVGDVHWTQHAQSANSLYQLNWGIYQTSQSVSGANIPTLDPTSANDNEGSWMVVKHARAVNDGSAPNIIVTLGTSYSSKTGEGFNHVDVTVRRKMHGASALCLVARADQISGTAEVLDFEHQLRILVARVA